MSKVAEAEPRTASQTELKVQEVTYVAFKEIYFLGLCTMLGGQCTKWYGGLSVGYWEYIVMILIVGSGSLCVALCAAEMSSMLPFTGGAYGYVRCALGPTAGFLAGFSEAVKYTLSVAATVNQLGVRILTVTHVPDHYAPAIWLLFYVVAVPILVRGGRTFWNVIMLLGAYIAVLLTIYCLGGLSIGSMHQGVTTFTNADGGNVFMVNVCQATVFFAGFNSVTLACSDVKDPTKVMPKAYIAWVLTAFVMAFCVLTAGVAMADSSCVLAVEKFPLNPGLYQLLGVAHNVLPLMIIPAVFANGLGNSFAAGRQIRSMAGSGLFPAFLKRTYHGSGEATPIGALCVCMLLGYLTLLFLYYTMTLYADELFQMSLYGSSVICVYLMRAYVVFYTRYSNIERQFVSPLGLYGAYYGMAVYITLFISVAFFYGENYDTFYQFMTIMAVAYLFYVFVASKTEFFSKEEQKMFMKAYIVNPKKNKKKGMLVVGMKAIVKALPMALRKKLAGTSSKVSAAASHGKSMNSSVNSAVSGARSNYVDAETHAASVPSRKMPELIADADAGKEDDACVSPNRSPGRMFNNQIVPDVDELRVAEATRPIA